MHVLLLSHSLPHGLVSVTIPGPRFLQEGGEVRATAPGLLAVATARLLPLVILVGEEDGLATNLGADGGKGDALLNETGEGKTVAVTLLGPAALQVDGLLAGADVVEKVDLALNEVTGLDGGDVRVEVGVDVGTGEVDDVAEGAGDISALPDVEGLSSGERAGVAGLGLDGGDEGGELLSSAVAVHDGLVTDNEEVDHVPVSPSGEGVDLLLDLGGVVAAARVLDEDTDNHANTVLLAGGGDSVNGIAVGRVDTDKVEAVVLDVGDVLLDLGGVLAFTGGTVVRGVGDTVVVTVSAEGAIEATVAGLGGLRRRLGRRLGGSAGGGLRSRGRLRGRLRNLGGGLRGLRNRRGSDRGLGSSSLRAGVGADSHEAGLGDGQDQLGCGVGTGSVAGGHGVLNVALLGHGGGDGSDGVGAGGGAHVHGVGDGAVDDIAIGHGGGHGAGDGGGGLDDGGDTTDSVSAGRNVSAGSHADGGGVGHGHGGSRESVGAGRRARDGLVGRQRHMDRGARGLRSRGNRSRRDGGRGNDGGGSGWRNGNDLCLC